MADTFYITFMNLVAVVVVFMFIVWLIFFIAGLV
jgi:hypothetical protein